MDDKDLNRRQFLKRLGMGAGAILASSLMEPIKLFAGTADGKVGAQQDGLNAMTYRVQRGTKDKVSLLGFGMMRLPKSQDEVNAMVDYAIAHGVNYFDTAPVYGNGSSEIATGIALKRHNRKDFLLATKMSNFGGFSLEEAKDIYQTSMKRLQVDYFDYYLLHAIGGGGMDMLHKRFLDNGVLDFLLEERKAGRIRNLGFSYHGDVKAFDYLLDNNDKYHWDFVQIEMNYVDWRHAGNGKKKDDADADAEYLYNKCEKLGIQNVVMEPLLGGRLANLPKEVGDKLKSRQPDATAASWAFRWVGSHPNIICALSGMRVMANVEENVKTFSPLDPCTTADYDFMEQIANDLSGFPVIPCTGCHYCMPCPFGVDIPGNFAYYNEAVNSKLLPLPEKGSKEYAAQLKKYQDGFRRAIPELKRASQCQDCEACLPKCPQQIRIPNQMARLVELCK